MKLKLCPFCANEPVMWESKGGGLYIQCGCGAKAPTVARTKNGALQIWNTRKLASIEKGSAEKQLRMNCAILEDTCADCEDGEYSINKD